MLQTQTVAEAEEDPLGCLGYTFGLQWSDPSHKMQGAKLLLEDTSYPKQNLCFLLCHSL